MTEPTKPGEGAGGSPPAGQGKGADTKSLTTRIEQLSAELTTAKQQVEQVAGERDTLKTANETANADLTAAQQQVTDLSGRVKNSEGAITNWETQHSQLTAEMGEAQANLAEANKELGLYKMISDPDKPEYHKLIGMVSGIRLVDDTKEQARILDAMSAGMQGQHDQALELLRAGATPPAGAAPKKQTPGTGASGNFDSPEAAWARYNQIAHHPGFEQEASALYQYLLSQQDGAGQQQPV